MKTKRLILIGVILIAIFPLASLLPVTVSAAPAAQAQVNNGGFESGTTGWTPWWAEIAKPSDASSFNYAYKPNSFNVESISAGAASALIYKGNSSYRVINNWDPWYAGARQVVVAPAGARVRLTAYGRAWASNNDWPDPSDTTAGVKMMVGIEPSGNENQFAGSVVWSGIIAPHNSWQPVSVEATVAASGKVAIFLSGDYRGTSRKFMGMYWDEVSLVVVSGGSGSTSVPGATSGPAPTNPPPQLPPFVMPTAGPDGNVVYIVQSGDSLFRIYANTGIPVDQIKAMNGLTSDIISVGQRLILVQGATSVPAPTTAATTAPTTANAGEPTATNVVEPTTAATEVANTTTAVGVVCVMVYDDANGNTLREEATEGLLAGGNITLVDTATGAPVQVYTTVGVDEPHCFENLPVGTYTISFAPPPGYNASGNSAPSLTLADGDLLNFEFGAQPSGSGSNTTTGGGGLSSNRLRTALFAAAGIIFLLLAAGVAGLLILRRPR